MKIPMKMKMINLALMLAWVTAAAPFVLGQGTSSPSAPPSAQTTQPSAASQSPATSQSPNVEQAPQSKPAESTTNPGSAPQSPGNAAHETNMAGQGSVSPQATVTPSNPAGNSATTGVGVNDAATLQSQIQNAMQNEPTLKNDNVNVSVNDSTIELSGNTQTGKEKETAYRIASSFAENRRVRDRITVSGRGTASNSPSANPQARNSPANADGHPNQPSNPQNRTLPPNPNNQQNPSANNPAANGDASTNPR